MLQVWRRSESTRGLFIRFDNEENLLMDYLRNNSFITLSGFKKLASLNGRKAEKILSDFILCGIIVSEANEKGIMYKLNIGLESIL